LGLKTRVLIAKCGLDGHNRGAVVVAKGLKDSGMEVIYTGLRQTPESVVNAAIQEDVDALGISILSGAHMYVFPRVLELLKELGDEDILVFGGGVIPKEDIISLKKMGVAEIFLPGTYISEIVDFLVKNIGRGEK
jgi:methylmalonyl-CoA mutase C-terminal domain/subunit